MKLTNLLFALALVLAGTVTVNAQRIKNLEGNISVLANESKLNVVFTYDNMRVGKYDHEADYIADKKADYNKKESGKGDKWEKSWIADRKSRFEPQFIELFEKNCKLALGNYPTAKYTMIINTNRTEPGYNIYVSRKNAEIDLDITIVETGTDHVVAKYSVKNAPGRTFGGGDYDTGARLEEAYAAAGKHLGKTFKSDMK
jgi:hypothetical protein